MRCSVLVRSCASFCSPDTFSRRLQTVWLTRILCTGHQMSQQQRGQGWLARGKAPRGCCFSLGSSVSHLQPLEFSPQAAASAKPLRMVSPHLILLASPHIRPVRPYTPGKQILQRDALYHQGLVTPFASLKRSNPRRDSAQDSLFLHTANASSLSVICKIYQHRLAVLCPCRLDCWHQLRIGSTSLTFKDSQS